MGFCCGDCCKCLKKKKKISIPAARSISSTTVQAILEGEPLKVKTMEEIEAHYKDMGNIYTYAVETVTYYLGQPTYPYITQRKQLYPYISFLCEDLDDHECFLIRQIISEKKLLNIQLTVVIKDAKVIHPKITEFSRIFCKLWITSGNEEFTSVKESSSYLLWDETFILDVSDYESDIFHVEIWSTRPGLLEKLTNFNFESFKEDDPLAGEKGLYFVGDAVEYIKSLPCVGQNMLWTLKKGPRRIYTKGQLNIYIQIGTKKSSDFILHLYCHMTIIRLCYEKEVLEEKECNKLWKNWLEILPNEAITLIQQHALQHGITPMEQCLCSWLVTSSLKIRHEDRISFYLLRDLLGHLLSNINEDEIGQMKDALCRNISDFSSYALDMLKYLHRNFDIFNTEMVDELYYMLRCMSTVEFQSMANYMDSFQSIEDEATEWYLKIIGDIKKNLQDDDSIERMCEGLKTIMKVYLKNQIVLDDIFMRAWNVRYSCITYKKLDEVVCTTIQPMIKHLMVVAENPVAKKKASESLEMLQLYHNVRNLVNYIKNCVPSQRAVIRMDDYSSWFGEEMVLEWFILCDNYTSPFIQRAVLADTMERLSPNVLHGTSVPDVAAIIDEMVIEVWLKLKWQDQFYTHGALIEATKSCVLDYSTHILERIQFEKFFCLSKDFEVNYKLCVALSNVYAMSQHLRKTNKKIKQELKVAESALGFELSDPLISIQGHMEIITAKIFLLVFEKIKDRAKNLVKQSVKRKGVANPGSVDLSSYMDNTLETMYTNLKKEVFYVILRHMWIVMLKSLTNGLKYSQGCFITKSRKLRIYMVILQTFNELKSIFFCDGHGLTQIEMENTICKELKCILEDKLQTE